MCAVVFEFRHYFINVSVFVSQDTKMTITERQSVAIILSIIIIIIIIIRPPDILVGGLGFHRDSIFFLSSFFRPLHSQLAERNSTKTGQMLGSKCDLKMPVRNLGYTLPCHC